MAEARYRNKYNRLDKPLHNVNKKIRRNKNEDSSSKQLLNELICEHLLPEMRKQDKLFKQLNRTLRYTGSSYEGLRISKVTDFDLNLDLRLSLICKTEVYCPPGCPPGLLKIKCSPSVRPRRQRRRRRRSAQEGVPRGTGGSAAAATRRPSLWISKSLPPEVSDEITRWLTPDGFIKRNVVLNWLKSVVDKALPKVEGVFKENGTEMESIRRSTSGPAITLSVDSPNGYFSVDLVPVLSFGEREWPTNPVRQPMRYDNETLDWCAVPKAYVEDEYHTFWRMSFYHYEKSLMNNRYTLKNVVKLMKFLRDKEEWHQIASYYIKTVALWMHDDEINWTNSLGMVFMETLSAFMKFLKEEKKIPFFWDSRHNLLSKLDNWEIEKVGNRLLKIIKKIEITLDENPGGIDAVIYGIFRIENSDVNANSQELVPAPRVQFGAVAPASSGLQTTDSSLGHLSDTFDTIVAGAVVVGGLALIGSLLTRAFNRNE